VKSKPKAIKITDKFDIDDGNFIKSIDALFPDSFATTQAVTSGIKRSEDTLKAQANKSVIKIAFSFLLAMFQSSLQAEKIPSLFMV